MDYLIVGARVIGLSHARKLKHRRPESKIVVLEKEAGLGRHSSGRNSSVLHSGIYYPVGSLKGQVCVEGAREMAAYCEEHGLPIRRPGKVMVPIREGDDEQLELLYERAKSNGARVGAIDEECLKELEPKARSATGEVLYSPDTAVIDSGAVSNHLAESLRARDVEILSGQRLEAVNPERGGARTNAGAFSYGHLFNSSGLHADRVAWAYGVDGRYAMLPFKGLYWRLAESSGLEMNGNVYLGPTAIPALGRKSYRDLAGMKPTEAGSILKRLIGQYWKNKQGFRRYTHEESLRFFKRRFAAAARVLAPNLRVECLLKSDKVGIRTQRLDQKKGELVMNFLVEHGESSTHVLNAVSPAFTSAFSFSRLVLDKAGVT